MKGINYGRFISVYQSHDGGICITTTWFGIKTKEKQKWNIAQDIVFIYMTEDLLKTLSITLLIIDG